MDPTRVDRAVAMARSLASSPWEPVAPTGHPPAHRAVLLGDPQTSLPRLMAVLDAHGLLGGQGWLAPGVALVSVGDHFDYGVDRAESAIDGLANLRWLAAHPPDRVVLLAGNHDLARVTELARVTDETFARARSLARAAMDGDEVSALAFSRDFPDIPTPEVAWRDYGAFTEAQRMLVQALLRGRRMHLARAFQLPDGVPVLVTHAGVTHRELGLLGLTVAPRADVLADLLEGRFRTAVDSVADRWAHGDSVRLPLEPFHVVGTGGTEGGGMLYHRPAVRVAPEDARFLSSSPRRFDPSDLPRGLVQAVGHSGHARNLRELGPWATPGARAHKRGGLRTLHTAGTGAVYTMGAVIPEATEATLYLIDGEMHHVEAGEVPVLELLPGSVTSAPWP